MLVTHHVALLLETLLRRLVELVLRRVKPIITPIQVYWGLTLEVMWINVVGHQIELTSFCVVTLCALTTLGIRLHPEWVT
jgi:hypothetical protein